MFSEAIHSLADTLNQVTIHIINLPPPSLCSIHHGTPIKYAMNEKIVRIRPFFGGFETRLKFMEFGHWCIFI